MSDNADPYATPRANLRENVKTMSTILAGTAGAVIAGSPFSGIGALDPATLRFALAIGGLLTVAVCLFLGWKALTFMLRPDLLDPIIDQPAVIILFRQARRLAARGARLVVVLQRMGAGVGIADIVERGGDAGILRDVEAGDLGI